MLILFKQVDFWNFFVRLLVAIACGTLIGAERQWRGRNAGLRTNVLVSLGSAIFSYLSLTKFGPVADASRVAAQIVSGIGFLGAGVIMRREDSVQGLNTATTIWTAAALGMAAGVGACELALLSAVLVLSIQVLFRQLSAAIDHLAARGEPKSLYYLDAVTEPELAPSIQERVQEFLREQSFDRKSTQVRTLPDGLVALQYGVSANESQIADLGGLLPVFLQERGVRDFRLHKVERTPIARFLRRRGSLSPVL